MDRHVKPSRARRGRSGALVAACIGLASIGSAAAQQAVECTGGNSIGIAVDTSASIMPFFYGIISDVAAFIDVTSGFATGTGNNNAYYVNTFANSVIDTTGSFMENSNGEVSTIVGSFPNSGGGTNISAGIQDLVEKFGTLPDLRTKPGIAIVFTDGMCGDPQVQADALRALGVTVAAVGVGVGTSSETLAAIASERADGSELTFASGDFGDIEQLFLEAFMAIDSDGDGVDDCADACPADPYKTDPGKCGCGVPDLDVCIAAAPAPAPAPHPVPTPAPAASPKPVAAPVPVPADLPPPVAATPPAEAPDGSMPPVAPPEAAGPGAYGS